MRLHPAWTGARGADLEAQRDAAARPVVARNGRGCGSVDHAGAGAVGGAGAGFTRLGVAARIAPVGGGVATLAGLAAPGRRAQSRGGPAGFLGPMERRPRGLPARWVVGTVPRRAVDRGVALRGFIRIRPDARMVGDRHGRAPCARAGHQRRRLLQAVRVHAQRCDRRGVAEFGVLRPLRNTLGSLLDAGRAHRSGHGGSVADRRGHDDRDVGRQRLVPPDAAPGRR